MTSKIISGAYPGGFTLTAGYGGLKLTSTASVGGTGVYVTATASVVNDGYITAGADSNDVGVYLRQGGKVTNAAGGYIEGYDGVLSSFEASHAAAVLNHGTIYASNVGVAINDGRIVNGGAADLAASISGHVGVELAAGHLTNYGRIFGGGQGGTAMVVGPSRGFALATYVDPGAGQATGATAVNLGLIEDGVGGLGAYVYGATLINGSATNTSAAIEGSGAGMGVDAVGAFGVGGAVTRSTIQNYGTIRAYGFQGVGVYIDLAGALTNGSVSDGAALITGYKGVVLEGARAVNLGTIIGGSDSFGTGVEMVGGYPTNYQADMVNGAVGHTSALIEGRVGVQGEPAGSAATIDNFGTILGTGGTAVLFESGNDVLAVEAGSVFEGAVIGGGGTLDLNSGAGSFSGTFSDGGVVTVNEGPAKTTYVDFATLTVGPTATFTDRGTVNIGANQSMIAQGAMTLGAAAHGVANAGRLSVQGGTLSVDGAVSGTGIATLEGGVLDFESGFDEGVTFFEAGTLRLAQSQTYGGTITDFAMTGSTALDLDDVGFVGAGEATFSGNAGGGVLTVTDGTHTAHIHLTGDYLGTTWLASNDGHGGVSVTDQSGQAPRSPIISAPSSHAFVAAMAGLGAPTATPVGPGEPWSAREPVLVAPGSR